ncbi:unnamed protein product, partial [Rangifer tarandus platyrhynchus]
MGAQGPGWAAQEAQRRLRGPQVAQRPAGGGQRRARKPETSGATWPWGVPGAGGPGEAGAGRGQRAWR